MILFSMDVSFIELQINTLQIPYEYFYNSVDLFKLYTINYRFQSLWFVNSCNGWEWSTDTHIKLKLKHKNVLSITIDGNSVLGESRYQIGILFSNQCSKWFHLTESWKTFFSNCISFQNFTFLQEKQIFALIAHLFGKGKTTEHIFV